MENILGTKLAGRYLIEDMVGVGGMCNVYRAFDSEGMRTVAVKMLRDEYTGNEEFLRRLRNESKAINTLDHPNIVKIYDVVLDTPNPYLVMEYVDGITLKEYIDRKKPLSGRSAANIAGLVLTALQTAHENGIVHRDVKPQNIMITHEGHVKVMDFGIARFTMSQSHTIDGNAIGSVHYISPEQARGDAVDQRADIYSVGVILFEMLSGALPFDAESPISVALQQIEETPRMLRSINPDVPAGLEQITMHAMAKDPDDRYAACGDMIHDLKLWLKDPSATFAYAKRNKKEEKKNMSNAQNENQNGKKKKHMTPLGRLFAVTCGVILVAALFVFVMFKIYDPFGTVEDISCPNLVGVDYTAATAAGAYPNIKIELQSQESNSEYGSGQIFEQTPAAGSSVKTGSIVKVKVSTGAQSITIPSFVNQEASAAYSKLTSLGLKYSTSELASDTVASGNVIRTSPEAGQSINAGSSVVVYVSKGSDKEQVQVPSVTGMTEQNASEALKSAQFSVNVVYQKAADTQVGLVLSQSPSSNSKAAVGAKVTITVGSADQNATGNSKINITVSSSGISAGTHQVKGILSGETVYDQSLQFDSNTTRITIPVSGTGTCQFDILVDGTVFKQFSIDFTSGKKYPDVPNGQG